MKFNFYISCENAKEAQACIKFIDQMTAEREDKPELPPFKTTATPVFKEATAVAPTKDVGRSNVSPGEPIISKIGEKARESCMAIARGEMDFLPSYTEHLKLLWKRGEVKFDGTEYYL